MNVLKHRRVSGFVALLFLMSVVPFVALPTLADEAGPLDQGDETVTVDQSPACAVPEGGIAFGFPDYPMVRSDWPPTTAGPFAVDVPAGTYHVQLTSFDRHVDEEGGAIGSSQPDEAYFVVGLSEGTEVWRSNSLPDLPDDENLLTLTVNSDLTIPASDQIMVHHTKIDDAPTESPNSIVAVCIVLIPQVQPPPPPPTTAPVEGTLIIEKVTVAEGDRRTFVFTLNGERFPLANGESKIFTGLPAGDYVAQEIQGGPANGFSWTLTGLTCSDGSTTDANTEAAVNTAAGTASISLSVGEVVTCTFTNTPVAVGGIQVTTTTSTTTTTAVVTASTLPFTGFESQDTALMGVFVLAGGALLLLAANRRDEEEAATPETGTRFQGWSR